MQSVSIVNYGSERIKVTPPNFTIPPFLMSLAVARQLKDELSAAIADVEKNELGLNLKLGT